MKKNNFKLLIALLSRLWAAISGKRKRQFKYLLLLMILVSFAEVVSIGSIIPFLGVLSNPQRVFEAPIAQSLIGLLGLQMVSQLLMLSTITFALAAIVAGILRLLLLWATARLSYATGVDLSYDIYRRTLYQPYSVHTNRNSSEVISGITNKVGAVISILTSVLALFSSVVILSAILIVIFLINPYAAFSVGFGVSLIYCLIILLTSRRQLAYSKLMAHESTVVIKSLQEGLGGIRDILIDGTQEVYCDIYRKSESTLRRTQSKSQFIGGSPRYVLEALGIVVITVVAYALTQENDGVIKAIPLLGGLAMAAQRLLPLSQQAYQSWSNIQSSQASLEEALNFLDQPLPRYLGSGDVTHLSFYNEIKLNHIFFRYDHTGPWIFENLSLTIAKGSRIGFIGATGAGKSTLMDIILGLLYPTTGFVEVDGKPITSENQRSWQACIAHVPQNIYLADATIAENIAFGVPKDRIDFERVRVAAERAQIANVIEGWDLQYLTVIGERGIRLSGGQRQRIGIARALYKEVNCIIFDEATSALDGETENAVMEAINNLGGDLTILCIAHRISTLRECSQIYELGNMGIVRVGSYDEVASTLI